jgi:hypothetical protein
LALHLQTPGLRERERRKQCRRGRSTPAQGGEVASRPCSRPDLRRGLAALLLVATSCSATTPPAAPPCPGPRTSRSQATDSAAGARCRRSCRRRGDRTRLRLRGANPGWICAVQEEAGEIRTAQEEVGAQTRSSTRRRRRPVGVGKGGTRSSALTRFGGRVCSRCIWVVGFGSYGNRIRVAVIRPI